MGHVRSNARILGGILQGTATMVAVAATSIACGGAAQPAAQPSSTTGSTAASRSDVARTSEQQRTVDAFAGEWLYHTKITLPDAKTVQADLTMSCQKRLAGKAVACSFGGDIPGEGHMDGSILVGTDRADNRVHFMAMTSDEELHDHVCAWKDASHLGCEPLRAGLGGQPATEDLSFVFKGNESSFSSITHLADGKKIVFEASGAKRSGGEARAAAAAKPAEVSADQKKVVDAFRGDWKWDADIALPNGERVKAALGFQCEPAGLGKAVSCSLAGKEVAGRPYEAAMLVGYDPFDKAVHFMLMSSDDEIWHRTCSWQGTKLACAPMDTSVLGMRAKTEIALDFAGARGAGVTRWDTKFSDGKSCSLQATMSRP